MVQVVADADCWKLNIVTQFIVCPDLCAALSVVEIVYQISVQTSCNLFISVMDGEDLLTHHLPRLNIVTF